MSSSSRTSGRASSQARVSAPIVRPVHAAAARASGLNHSISGPPRAAASWLPRTPTAPISRQPGDDPVRIRPVADDVAELPDGVEVTGVGEDRVEGKEVAVDVRQDRDPHRRSG